MFMRPTRRAVVLGAAGVPFGRELDPDSQTLPPVERRADVASHPRVPVRRTALDEAKKLKASGALTEDQLRDVEDEVQKLTDRFVKSIDDHLKHKDAEVMKV